MNQSHRKPRGIEPFETEAFHLGSSTELDDVNRRTFPRRRLARSAWLDILKESPLLALTLAVAAISVFAIVMAMAISQFGSGAGPAAGRPATLAPPMGWSTAGPFYKAKVKESVVMAAANALVASGLAAAGYKYVIVDEGWADTARDEEGALKASLYFPSGILALATYVREKGLKLGLYAAAGYSSCDWRIRQAGSLNFEDVDARTFASWGVEYVKYDDCSSDNVTSTQERYERMGRALKRTRKQMYFALCDRGASRPWEWAKGAGHSWRTTNDIFDRWDSMRDIADFNDRLATFAGPGAWNDPDLLKMGSPHMKLHEAKSQLAIWALMKAPLILGSDVTKLGPAEVELLTDRDLIDINQDPLGVQGRKMSARGDLEVWAGPLSRSRLALALWNRGRAAAPITAHWSRIGLDLHAAYLAREVWTNQSRDGVVGSLQATVGSHQVKLFILSPSSSTPPPEAPPPPW